MTASIRSLLAAGVVLPILVLLSGCETKGGSSRVPRLPAEYVGKHMPAGWWADESIVEEGRALYLGLKNRDVNCAKCHGRNGKPVKAGARDFRDTEGMKRYSDSYLLWRLAEGVPFTRMAGYKDRLSEEQMWKIIAFVRTFGLDGLRYDVASQEWVPVGGDGSADAPAPNQQGA